MEIINNIINILGQYAPIILILISIFLLKNTTNLLFYYIIGIFINTLLNIILKIIIQQPRPNDDSKMVDIALKNGKRFIFKNNIIPFNIFGMPSGHSQSSFFSTTFIFLSLKNIRIVFLYLFLSFITIYQRVKYNYHTIFQVIVGAIVGIIFAYIMFYFSQQNIKSILKEKEDDNAPI